MRLAGLSSIPVPSGLRVGISSLPSWKADGFDVFDDIIDGASNAIDVW